jgi:hypothetical protein
MNTMILGDLNINLSTEKNEKWFYSFNLFMKNNQLKYNIKEAPKTKNIQKKLSQDAWIKFCSMIHIQGTSDHIPLKFEFFIESKIHNDSFWKAFP